MTTQKIIITGGAGFIGSHLSERLLSSGHQLILVDNLSTGRKHNVDHLIGDRCQLLEADVIDAFQDPLLFTDVSAIYHLAASVGVKRVIDDPTGMIKCNIYDTTIVLEAAAKHDIPVLITSSSEVYGKCPAPPLKEDMDLVYGPTTASRWSYGLSKAIDEHLAIDLYNKGKVKPVIVRLFNTIGPRQIGEYGMVVPRFIEKALADQPITVYGDGNQTRAFCDARDIVRAMTLLMNNESCFGEVYNLGSDTVVTINELAELVNKVTQNTAGIERVAYEAIYGKNFEDPQHRKPDVTKIKNAIGFEPEFTLEDTIVELAQSKQITNS
ncbi:NAD-dependent epimerase/dehydratase family protein [Poriferisphaera sp. WC338]|uniref:NAD-dependent epimerase/dehydratase family protein n=1 Tax=Poriferisphaera sp. WC338 TaxID=3425129 RepID=UPI003D819E0E